jgi:hypothetical protein
MNLTRETRLNLLREWVKRYRRDNPRSRIESPFKITRNGGTKRVYGSLVNDSSISMCAVYPVTRRVLNWMSVQEEMAITEMYEIMKGDME